MTASNPLSNRISFLESRPSPGLLCLVGDSGALDDSLCRGLLTGRNGRADCSEYRSDDGRVYFRLDSIPSRHSAICRLSRGGREWVVAVEGEIFPRNGSFALAARDAGKRTGSDAVFEHVITLYERLGRDFLRELGGWYNIVIYDPVGLSLFVGNDPYAFNPFYYQDLGHTVAFSSQLAVFAALLGAPLQVDDLAVLESAFLNYSLGDMTNLKGIRRLPPASGWLIEGREIRKRSYFDVRSLLDKAPLDRQESLERASSRFRDTVRRLSSDGGTIGLTLTAGFDSRTILSVLDTQDVEVRAFTFGQRGCTESEIARQVAIRAGVSYQLVELGKGFTDRFEAYARRTAALTGGTVTMQRAHYLYAFEQQAQVADVVLTGVGGSELLRPVHNTGAIYNPRLVDILNSDEPEREIEHSLDTFEEASPFDRDFIRTHRPALNHSLKQNLVDRFVGLSRNARFLLLNLQEVFPKYFGAEVKLENSVCHVRPPFMDSDFIDLIVRTPFSALHNSPFVDSPVVRRNAQLFHSYTIERYRPELGTITTDRGFPPRLNNFHLGYMVIAPLYMRHWLANRFAPGRHVPSLKPYEWAAALLHDTLSPGSVQRAAFLDRRRVEGQLERSKESADALRDVAFAASHLLWRDEMGLE